MMIDHSTEIALQCGRHGTKFANSAPHNEEKLLHHD
jgi:hypothetical protein